MGVGDTQESRLPPRADKKKKVEEATATVRQKE